MLPISSFCFHFPDGDLSGLSDEVDGEWPRDQLPRDSELSTSESSSSNDDSLATIAANQQPAPRPESVANQQPAPRPDSVANQQPAPRPDSVANQQPAPRPDGVANQQPAPRPDSVANQQPAPRPDGVANQQPAPRPDGIANQQPAPRPDGVANQQPAPRPDGIANQQPAPRPDGVANQQPAPRPDGIANQQPAPRPDGVANQQPAPRPDSVANQQPAPRPDGVAHQQPAPRPDSVANQQPAPRPDGVVNQQPASRPDGVANQQPAPRPDSVANQQPVQYKFERRKYVRPTNTDFVVENVENVNESVRTPYEHFKSFVSNEMLESVVFESNKNALQKGGIILQLTVSELEVFLGIYFQMGLFSMPAVGCYWQGRNRYAPIADAMSRNMVMQITSNLHFVDNLLHDANSDDRIWKLRSWLDSLRQTFGVVASMEFQSIDEIMIAFKGRSLVNQYLTKKPTKWGIKVWVGVQLMVFARC